MEKIVREPFQGISNIIKFNWHFYVLAITAIFILFLSTYFLPDNFIFINYIIVLLIFLGTLNSLAVSYYVYDHSNLYSLNWLNFLSINSRDVMVNVHAGFDETSFLLDEKFTPSNLIVFDFYDPTKHTEISIKRARKVQTVYPDTQTISSYIIPLNSDSVDYMFSILSAHEIRNLEERIIFFKGLKDCLKREGRIVVVEHLRDTPNFLAYNFGFFHFFSRKEWICTFKSSELEIEKEFKITPFLSAFILKKYGTTT